MHLNPHAQANVVSDDLSATVSSLIVEEIAYFAETHPRTFSSNRVSPSLLSPDRQPLSTLIEENEADDSGVK